MVTSYFGERKVLATPMGSRDSAAVESGGGTRTE